MIEYVPQEESGGCLVACVAMVAGRTYREIREMCSAAYNDGIWEGVADNILDELGFALVRRYKHAPRLKASRDAWPCAPFAPVHISLVHATRGPHAIVVLDDGSVLDPWARERVSLADPAYTQIDWIAGYWRRAA